MTRHLSELLGDAKAAGILPASATDIPHINRPWPVVLLTALGAWLAAVPLFGVVALLIGNVINTAPGMYLVGALTLTGALTVLRSRSVALFVEQLAVPALIVGGICLGTALYKDFSGQLAAALVTALALGAAAIVSHAWLRVLLGFVAACFVTAAIIPGDWISSGSAPLFSWLVASYLALAFWLAAYVTLGRAASARYSAALESIAAGWVLSIILGCAMWAGVNLLQTPAGGDHASHLLLLKLLQGVSLLFAIGAGAWLVRRWPSVNQSWLIGVALVLAGLAWMMPSLGAAMLVLALCATSRRWLLAGAAAVASAWIVGAFYYQLSFPLATKAIMLALAGALLGLMAWFGAARTAGDKQQVDAAPPTWKRSRWAIVIALVGVVGAANIGIWKNERLIATGQPVFVELAPVDPRSLMQGDYMRLNFAVPGAWEQGLDLIGGERPHVVARRDIRGIATLLRLHGKERLAPGEFLIELSPKDGRWTFVTDAWFFKEGEAKRWQGAKYGEFRVSPDGKALLVDLRGSALEKL